MKRVEVSHCATYNGLMDVIEADAALTAHGRGAVIDALCEVLLRHGVHGELGVRLLHRHNDISSGEIMLEREERDAAGRYSLTTLAVTAASAPGALHPNSWSLRGETPEPLEFSLEPEVGEAGRALNAAPGLVGDFRATLQRLGVADLLGLCVLDRAFYARVPPDRPGWRLVESTDAARRANVIRHQACSSAGSLIETVWEARGLEPSHEVRLGCQSQTTTRPVCQRNAIIHCDASGQGGHKRWTENIHDPTTETVTTHTFSPS